MKIGLISDTHGYLDAWNKALGVFGNVDLVIHTGDILSSGPFNPRTEFYKPAELANAINAAPFPMVFAKGNCDAEVDSVALDYIIESPYALVYSDNLTILAVHGHQYDKEKLIDMGLQYKLNVIVSGHTHVRGISRIGGVTFVNPGSAALPKTEDELPTVGIIENRSIRIISLVDGSELEQVSI